MFIPDPGSRFFSHSESRGQSTRSRIRNTAKNCRKIIIRKGKKLKGSNTKEDETWEGLKKHTSHVICIYLCQPLKLFAFKNIHR
jgi:hypothetical protein